MIHEASPGIRHLIWFLTNSSFLRQSYFTEVQVELLSLIHSPVTAPGKGLLTATVEKEVEAPPKGVMTEEDPPNGVSPVVRLLKLLVGPFRAGDWPIWVGSGPYRPMCDPGAGLVGSGRYFCVGPLSSLLLTQPIVKPVERGINIYQLTDMHQIFYIY